MHLLWRLLQRGSAYMPEMRQHSAIDRLCTAQQFCGHGNSRTTRASWQTKASTQRCPQTFQVQRCSVYTNCHVPVARLKMPFTTVFPPTHRHTISHPWHQAFQCHCHYQPSQPMLPVLLACKVTLPHSRLLPMTILSSSTLRNWYLMPSNTMPPVMKVSKLLFFIHWATEALSCVVIFMACSSMRVTFTCNHKVHSPADSQLYSSDRLDRCNCSIMQKAPKGTLLVQFVCHLYICWFENNVLLS